MSDNISGWKFLQNLQKNICVGFSSLIKLQALGWSKSFFTFKVCFPEIPQVSLNNFKDFEELTQVVIKTVW